MAATLLADWEVLRRDATETSKKYELVEKMLSAAKVSCRANCLLFYSNLDYHTVRKRRMGNIRSTYLRHGIFCKRDNLQIGLVGSLVPTYLVFLLCVTPKLILTTVSCVF